MDPKNRNRENFSFANINFLGRCNVDCFFCLGKDIKEELAPFNQTNTPVYDLPNLQKFLNLCKKRGVQKIYITGQNTDSLLYAYLDDLVNHLHSQDFKVGLRTNGYLALKKIDTINKCELSTGYSIHALDSVVNKMIMGRKDLPDWDQILSKTLRPRVSIVVNRCNETEIFNIIRYLSRYDHIRYVQVRRVSTDTRTVLLAPDIAAYERVYTKAKEAFGPCRTRIWEDAEVYKIHGHDAVFWRTVKTSVNSLNYFSDGTISEEYFVVEGYLKHRNGK